MSRQWIMWDYYFTWDFMSDPDDHHISPVSQKWQDHVFDILHPQLNPPLVLRSYTEQTPLIGIGPLSRIVFVWCSFRISHRNPAILTPSEILLSLPANAELLASIKRRSNPFQLIYLHTLQLWLITVSQFLLTSLVAITMLNTRTTNRTQNHP
jgi:hypothetical protein